MSKYKNLPRGEHTIDGVRLFVIDDFSAVSLGAVAEKIVEPHPEPMAEPEPEPETPAQLVNVNEASLDELQTLDGVGEAAAKRIVKGRPYETIDGLVRVRGVSNRTVDANRDRLTV